MPLLQHDDAADLVDGLSISNQHLADLDCADDILSCVLGAFPGLLPDQAWRDEEYC